MAEQDVSKIVGGRIGAFIEQQPALHDDLKKVLRPHRLNRFRLNPLRSYPLHFQQQHIK